MMNRILASLLPSVCILLAGCGGTPTKISGKVTCSGKPVRGSILISPEAGDGPAVPTVLREDGTFDVEIKTTGKHNIVVSPADVVYPARPGQEFPCDLSAITRDLQPGPNDLQIVLPPLKP